MKYNSKIDQIMFDMTLNGKEYKNITLDYPEETITTGKYSWDWKLTLEDIYGEDNDSWCMVQVGDKMIDFQIFGNDDELGMKAELSMQGCIMKYDADKDCYNHTDEWLYDFAYNVRIISGNEIKLVRLMRY